MQSEIIRATCRSASRSDASCTRGDLASRATEPAVRSGGEMLPLRFTRRGRAVAAASSSSAIAPPPPAAAALPLAPASAPPSVAVGESSLRWSGESRALW